ncbi:hypothetical protein BJ878DRAFT_86007 [Calycina marina]|uniref:Tyrosinase copper-binding domain-containing protein n=1 Tax=Calycina marina TaxID=1763456 RepID=A0A9P7Z3A8_9HELO|nr:hypothetical protein BJ878DRAFT_86007 [Calycina marina]
MLFTILLHCLALFIIGITAQHLPITGAKSGINNNVPPYRRDIRELQKDNVAWSIYIQALITMQTEFQSNPLSWFQIAGIHGRPYMPYDDVPIAPGGWLYGYCMHSSALFATWHRPYLALFEQSLSHYAQKIAIMYPSVSRAPYVDAAQNLRMPYWDWASDPRMPDFLNTAQVIITTPTGVQNVNNPLASYKFQGLQMNTTMFPSSSGASRGDYFLAGAERTIRNPDVMGGLPNIQAANDKLANQRLKELTYLVLTSAPDWNTFATSGTRGISVEAIHNILHSVVGGQYGHFLALSYSAFDPIFWLHHTNVDRLAALYQAVHPDSWVVPTTESYGTFAVIPGSVSNENTSLSPFSTDVQGDLWTSRMSRPISVFGYSYPEIQYWNQTPQQLAASVSSSINYLYGPSNPSRKRASGSRRMQTTWNAATSVNKLAAGGGAFFVRFFLGAIPADAETWATDAANVGSFAVLATPMQFADQISISTTYFELSLSSALRERGIDGQDIGGTTKYLEDNLQWRIQLVNETVLDNVEAKDLSVSVHEITISLGRQNSELPNYSNNKMHLSITNGKLGGAVQC